MAITYPLKPIEPTQYQGKSPSAVTNESKRYKDMLGSQAAGVDVGLFYQLNVNAVEAATAAEEDIGNYTKGDSRLFNNIKNYGNYSTPIEAGGEYA